VPRPAAILNMPVVHDSMNPAPKANLGLTYLLSHQEQPGSRRRFILLVKGISHSKISLFTMASFADLNTSEGLNALEQHLVTRSYISG
jgi:hypothetical protein